MEALRRRIKERGSPDAREVKGLLKEIIAEMLEGGQELNLSTKPAVILVIGVQRGGQDHHHRQSWPTSSKREGKTVLLAAADLPSGPRPSTSWRSWADRAGVDPHQAPGGSGPAAVVFDAVKCQLRAGGGRHHLRHRRAAPQQEKPLMDELAKISRVICRELPDSAVETLLVLDGTTGQNALNQAKLLFGGPPASPASVLTKLDYGTARGSVVIGIKEN